MHRDRTMNPIVRERLIKLVHDNPGSTDAELAALDGDNILARQRMAHYLPILRDASLARRDDFGRWWVV